MAADDLGVMDADEIDGGTRAPSDAFNRAVMAVQSSDAHKAARGLPLELVTHGDLTGGDGAGHDGTVTRHRERAVDRHAEQPGVRRGLDLRRRRRGGLL